MRSASSTDRRLATAFRRLGEVAAAEGVVVEVCLCRWQVFTVAFDAAAGGVRGGETARRLSAQVAQEQDLSEGWLKEEGRLYLLGKEAKRELASLDWGEALRFTAPGARYLLALLLSSGEEPATDLGGDAGDLRVLLNKLGLRSLDGVEAVLREYFPEDALPAAQREHLERLIAAEAKA